MWREHRVAMKKIYLTFLLLFFILSCKNFNKININFYYKDTYDTEIFLEQKIKKFTSDNPNIHINTNKKSKMDFLTDLEKNKKKIDFIRYPSNFLPEFVDKKLLKSCNDIFEKSFIEQISDKALQTSIINNQLWGIPDNYINYPIMYYNKLTVKDPPKNTNELIKINNQLKYRYNNLGIYINLKEPFFIYPWLNGFKIDLFNNDNKLPNINQKQVIDALQFIYDLKYKYNIISQYYNKNELKNYINNNSISFFIDGDWSLDFYKNVLGENLGISLIPPIAGSGEDNYIMISTMCYSIMKTTSKRKTNAIKEFLKYILSEEVENQWIKQGRISTIKSSEKENNYDILFKDLYNISTKSKPYSSNINVINKALRPQLEKLIDDKISPKYAVKNAQDDLEKIYK
jgi:arabinogalactan oligomer/maltooligosaccharide transport system substrate-binding protein